MKGVNERIKKSYGTINAPVCKLGRFSYQPGVAGQIDLKKHAFQFGVGMGQSWALYGEENFERYRTHMGESSTSLHSGFNGLGLKKKGGNEENPAY